MSKQSPTVRFSSIICLCLSIDMPQLAGNQLIRCHGDPIH